MPAFDLNKPHPARVGVRYSPAAERRIAPRASPAAGVGRDARAQTFVAPIATRFIDARKVSAIRFGLVLAMTINQKGKGRMVSPTAFVSMFREHDWAATPLGAIEDWQGSLAAPVGYMLASRQAIFIIAGPEKIFLFNEALAQLLGPRWPEALGKSVVDMMAPVWSERGPLIDRAYKGESFLLQDAAFRTWSSRFREKRFYTLSFNALMDRSGEVIGACCSCSDTTDAVLGRQRIAAQMARVCRMFDHSTSFVLAAHGPEHRIVYANAALDELTARKAVIGERVSDIYPESVWQGVTNQFDQVLGTGKNVVIEHAAYEIDHTDSKVSRTVSMVFEPIYEFDELPVGVFVVGQDKTPFVDAECRADTLQAELIHASRVNAVGALGSAIAHELNQPLATISNYAATVRMALNQNGSREQIEECLDGINSAAIRAGEVIRSVRELVRKGTPKRQTFRLLPVARDALRLICVGDYADRKVTLDIPEKLSAWGDPTQIEQVLINLLRNACESTGSKSPAAAVTTKRRRGMVEIAVEDYGPGIPPESLAHIFTPFQTSKETGLGLGLSICRTIVEAHGGQIKAENKPETGAAFRFTIPASPRP